MNRRTRLQRWCNCTEEQRLRSIPVHSPPLKPRGSSNSRVGPGSRLPRPPTDLDVRRFRIRLLRLGNHQAKKLAAALARRPGALSLYDGYDRQSLHPRALNLRGLLNREKESFSTTLRGPNVNPDCSHRPPNSPTKNRESSPARQNRATRCQNCAYTKNPEALAPGPRR